MQFYYRVQLVSKLNGASALTSLPFAKVELNVVYFAYKGLHLHIVVYIMSILVKPDSLHSCNLKTVINYVITVLRLLNVLRQNITYYRIYMYAYACCAISYEIHLFWSLMSPGSLVIESCFVLLLAPARLAFLPYVSASTIYRIFHNP